MARIRPVSDRSVLDSRSGQVWDEITASRGSVRGPFPFLLHNPELARRVASLGSYIRFESALSFRQRELAMLSTFRLFDCAYGWEAHRQLARDAGIAEPIIEAIARGETKSLEAQDLLIYELVAELISNHAIADDAFERVHASIGTQALLDLVGTIGYTACVAIVLNALGVEAQER